MKNKRFKNIILFFSVILLVSIIYISGCDSTKGKSIPTSPSGDTLTLTASPSTVSADGASSSTINAAITGNVPGEVTFTASLGTLSASIDNADSNGNATVTLTSSEAGTATVTAIAGTYSATATVTFGLGGLAISGTGDVTDTADTTTESTTISFTITDSDGDAVSGSVVTLATPTTNHSSITSSWANSAPTTNSSGVATSVLTTNSADIGVASVTVTFTATATGTSSATGQVLFLGTDAGCPCP